MLLVNDGSLIIIHLSLTSAVLKVRYFAFCMVTLYRDTDCIICPVHCILFREQIITDQTPNYKTAF